MKNRDEDLRIHEAILLLALRDQEGTILPGTMYQYALAGALLAELLLNERVELETERRAKYLRLVSSKPTGDALLDECLDRIAKAKRRATLQTWVERFAGISKLKHRIAEPLCRAGILRMEEGQVLVFFHRKLYPELDPLPEDRLIERIRRAIVSETPRIDAPTTVVIALAYQSSLLKAALPKSEIKSHRKRIEQIAKGEIVGQAVKGAIQALQAAILVAAVIPVIYSSQ